MVLHYLDDQVTLHHGDALDILRTLPDESVDCCVTSPPYYGLRDYGEPGQYGLEPSPAEYVETMRAVFAEVRRVLAPDGTLWLNLGDSYSAGGQGNGGKHSTVGTVPQTARTTPGIAPKNLLGIPWRLALALQGDGWTLRSDIIWQKPNAMPESVTDRPSCTYEHIFLLAKQPRYWFDLGAIREPLTHPEALDGTRVFGGKNGSTPPGHTGGPKNGGPGPHHEEANPRGRNPGDVWEIATSPFPEAHFAAMAPELARRCIAAGCKPGGVVLDPFAGSCTTGMVALRHGRRFIGIDLSATYLDLALRTRLAQGALIETEATP